MKRILLALALAAVAVAQQPVFRWSATTGDLSLSAAATTATLQQPTTGAALVSLESAIVYCSVNCNVTQAANGTAATGSTTAIQQLMPMRSSLSAPVSFYASSNVGAGTAQGGITHVPAGGTVTICLSTACGNSADVQIPALTGLNYSVAIAAITGTANITFIFRTVQ